MLLLFVPASVLFSVLIFLFLVSPYGRRTILVGILVGLPASILYAFDYISTNQFIFLGTISVLIGTYILVKLYE